MATGRIRGVVRRLRQTALLDNPAHSDSELLQRYVTQRDQAAFAVLLRRHGPMVLGVCRRVLRDPHDVDDAFQATFLVLVRKASSIAPRERVGAWLHGVAYRTSLKAQAMNSRRRHKQQSLEDLPAPAAATDADWLALLDQEIHRLPEKYRLPIVLCDLEGKTRKQAARTLGWPEGTLATRLQHGRALVQKRLARHGLPLSAGAVSLVWAGAVTAEAVPAGLTGATVNIASLFEAGKAAGLIPLNVLALAQGVLQAMTLSKVKSVTALIILAGALTLGGLGGWWHSAAVAQAPTEPAAAGAPIPPPPAPSVFQPAHETIAGRLPTGPAPFQALVSLDKDKLVVKTASPSYQPRQMTDKFGRLVTGYELMHSLQAARFDRKEVDVYDTRGRKLDNRDLPKWLKEEIPALVLFGRELDPLHLRLIKEGTLVFSVPVQMSQPTLVAEPAVQSWPSPLALPVVPAQPAPPPALPRDARIDQAERDLSIAAFYLTTGQRGSAAFYYELVQKRYAGTSYAQRAGQFLRELRQLDNPPVPANRDQERVGEIIIVGSKKVPETVILANLPLYPGQVLNTKDLRAAEDKLRGMKEFSGDAIVRLRPTIAVLDSGKGLYKDILITVQESLAVEVLAELRKIEGTWTVTAVTYEGTQVPNMVGGELSFAGDQLAWKNKTNVNRSTVSLDLSEQPHRIRLVPNDGPAGARASAGTYEIQGHVLKLSLRPVPEGPADASSLRLMVLTLKRKLVEEARVFRGADNEFGVSGFDVDKAPYRLDLRSKGLTLAFATFDILADGRVALTKCTIWRTEGTNSPQIIRGERVLLTMDGPVQAIVDLSRRNIVSMQMDGGSAMTP
jgi:RNA polymerase sigma factor (sigma-70 family)